MKYIEYEQYKRKYYNAQNECDKILSELEHLFQQTQPKATNYDKDIVEGGTNENVFDNYLIQKDKKQLDKKLEEVKYILKTRYELLLLKKEEVKNSNNYYDRVYYYKYIENIPVKQIIFKIPYCKSQIYDMLKTINENIGQNRKNNVI